MGNSVGKVKPRFCYRAFSTGTKSLPHAGQRTRSLSSLTKSIGAMECGVAGVAHTRRTLRLRDSSRARLSSLMRPMSLLESCSLEANSQRTRHFSGSCLSSIGRPLLKWQDQVRHCETRHVSYRVQRWTAVLELAVHQQFESCL